MAEKSETNGTSERPESPGPTFDSIPLSAELRKAVDAIGYTQPTPVQLAVFEPAVRGKNLVVQARTGTGKTAAFGLPILDQLIRRSVPKVQALALTPTRELALQVTRELERLAQFRGTKIAAIYGGASAAQQIEALKQGAQFVVGTPGRVLDHIRRGTFDTTTIRVFVLDEADEMLSMGFAKELHAICDALPKERQGLFFSATIPPDIERLAAAQLKEPEFVTLSSDQVGALEIAHYVYVLSGGVHDKRQILMQILDVEDPESAIIFCNTKDETERLAEALQNRGYDADWLNGDLEQKERERVMGKTREGKLRFLVATDVAARGIDVSHLSHVINYDFPESAEAYVHRTGRTGRAGKTGTAIALVGPKDIGNLYLLRLTYKIRPIEKALPTKGELKTRAEQDVVQLFEDACANRDVHPDDLAIARRLLTHDEAEKIVACLIRDHLGARPNPNSLGLPSGEPLGGAKTEAAEARRAKNPPPTTTLVPPHPIPDPRDVANEVTLPTKAHEVTRPDQAHEVTLPPKRVGRVTHANPPSHKTAPPRPPRRGVPHAAYANWQPADDPDDDRPIFSSHAEKGPPSQGTLANPVERGTLANSVERGTLANSNSVERAPLSAVETGFAQIFVNVGRRDGAHPEDLQRLLEAGSLTREETGPIRMRDRVSFVSVKKEAVERALYALAGQVINGRTLNAELAKTR